MNGGFFSRIRFYSLTCVYATKVLRRADRDANRDIAVKNRMYWSRFMG